MRQPIYRAIASALDASARCREKINSGVREGCLIEWESRHIRNAEEWVKKYLPTGSGFDGGTKLDVVASKPTRLVFNTAFHHMDENGYYDDWSYHNVIVTESLLGLDVWVSGRDRNNIKEYIADMFRNAADVEVE